jgi:hypothetical protein
MSWFTALEKEIAGWFGSHSAKIQHLANDGAALADIAALAYPPIAPVVTALGAALTETGIVATPSASAITLTQQAAKVTSSAVQVMQSGAALITDVDAKNKVANVLTKASAVVNALQDAADMATPGTGTTTTPVPMPPPPTLPESTPATSSDVSSATANKTSKS